MPGHTGEAWKRCRIHCEGNHRWWDVSLWVWPRNQTMVISVEGPIISMPKREDKFTQMQRACSFYTIIELYIINLFYKDEL
jgi:hypothetical protein